MSEPRDAVFLPVEDWPAAEALAARLAVHCTRFAEAVEPLIPTDYRKIPAWRKADMRELCDEDASALAVGLLDRMAAGGPGTLSACCQHCADAGSGWTRLT